MSPRRVRRIGLSKGLSSIRGMRKELTLEQQGRIAETIVHPLENSNWKIEQGEPGRVLGSPADLGCPPNYMAEFL